MTGTRKMHTTLSPYSGIPWRTGSSSTTSCLTVMTTSDTSLQSWEPNPCRCMPNGCLLAAKRNGEWPRQKLLPSSTEYNRVWHTMSTPMRALENLRMLWPGWEGTPKISLHTSDTDGLLWDDQWCTPRAQAALLYHPCIPPWGRAPWQTYGKTIQDTFQWASWHHHEPLCHSACPRTSLPQLQTCEHNLPWQTLSSLHQQQ